MARVEVHLPEHVDADIQRLVDEGEFINRGEAFEELLTHGISAYTQSTSAGGDDEEFGLGDEMRNPGSDLRDDGFGV
jgi:Arc/MetJ-type ribon-helix-helix transcriptional regulator